MAAATANNRKLGSLKRGGGCAESGGFDHVIVSATSTRASASLGPSRHRTALHVLRTRTAQTTRRHLRGEQSPASRSVPGPETIPAEQGDSAIGDGRLRAQPVHRQRSSAPGRGPAGMGCDQEVNDKPSRTARSTVARARTTAARYAQRLEATTLGRMWSRLLEIEFVDRAIALAAKAFVSFLPLLVIVSALSPDSVREKILAVFSTRFGVTGDAYATVTHAFTSPEQTKTAAGIIGTLTTVAFAVSFTTALQRVFLRAWRRPPGGGARNQARGAAWLGAVLVLLLMVVAAGVVLTGPLGSVF